VKKLFLLGLILSVSCDRGDPAESAPILRFTAIPDDNTTELKQKFGPFAEFLSQELGLNVEYLPTSSYAASVEAFKNGDVHLAWFGGLTGVQARAAVTGATAIAQGKIDPIYRSYFIANQQSGLKPSRSFPMGLKGKSFTFGSPSSTSGRLMPEHFIRENTGNSPQEFFGGPMQFSGSHDKTALLVQAGTFDAGVLSYKTYEKLVENGKLNPTQCFILWTTPHYPDYNWTAHPNLETQFGKGTTSAIQTALLKLEDTNLLNAILRPEGLIPASNADFMPVQKLALNLGFLR